MTSYIKYFSIPFCFRLAVLLKGVRTATVKSRSGKTEKFQPIKGLELQQNHSFF